MWDEEWELGNIDNDTGALISSSTYIRAKNFIKVSPNTAYCRPSFSIAIRIFFYDKDKKYISNTISSSFSTPINCEYILLKLNQTSYSGGIAIYLGSTATSYTPHAEQNFTLPCQQPMRSTSIAKDCFFKNVVGSEYYNAELTENAWYERHIIVSKTFNGSNDEGWSERTNLTETKQFYCATNFSYIQGLAHQADVQLCNYATYFYGAYNYGTVGTFSVLDNTRRIYVCVNSEMTLEQWKTKLATKNLEVLCALVTPTYLQCTQAQTEVLEAISKAKSYYEQTNISSTDTVSPVYTVEAYQDMNLVIDEISQAIVANGGV